MIQLYPDILNLYTFVSPLLKWREFWVELLCTHEVYRGLYKAFISYKIDCDPLTSAELSQVVKHREVSVSVFAHPNSTQEIH